MLNSTFSSILAYDRDLFNHWITINGTCNTRETVLKRDGTGVTVDSACATTGGSWTSVYDGVTSTNSSSFDIDHMIPLKVRFVGPGSTHLLMVTRRRLGSLVLAAGLMRVARPLPTTSLAPSLLLSLLLQTAPRVSPPP